MSKIRHVDRRAIVLRSSAIAMVTAKFTSASLLRMSFQQIDKQDALNEKRSKLSDEFFVLNPEYVGKCSGTTIKECKDFLTARNVPVRR